MTSAEMLLRTDGGGTMLSRWSSAPADQAILVVRWRQHPVVLVPPVAPAVITATAAFLLSPGGRPSFGSVLLWWLTLPLALRFAWRAAGWWFTWVIVANRQILRVSGLFVREREVVPLVHVTGLTYRRSVLGRMFGYGECVLQAAGPVQAPMRISYMPNPDHCYSLLRGLLAGDPPDQRTRNATVANGLPLVESTS